MLRQCRREATMVQRCKRWFKIEQSEKRVGIRKQIKPRREREAVVLL